MLTNINHRRMNRGLVLRHGYVKTRRNGWIRTPTGYLDKSMRTWTAKAPVAGKHLSASIGNDFCKGNRGMARDVAGAKKFVRSRLRFHENAETRRLVGLVVAGLD